MLTVEQPVYPWTSKKERGENSPTVHCTSPEISSNQHNHILYCTLAIRSKLGTVHLGTWGHIHTYHAVICCHILYLIYCVLCTLIFCLTIFFYQSAQIGTHSGNLSQVGQHTGKCHRCFSFTSQRNVIHLHLFTFTKVTVTSIR